MMEENNFCYTCSNEGFYDKDCPECLKPRRIFTDKTVAPEKSMALDGTLDNLMIPENYKHVTWDAEIFWTSRPDLVLKARSMGVNRIAELETILARMDKIQQLLINGFIPKFSAFVILPPNFGKSVWAFSCMRFALASGLSVAPYLDTLEAAALLASSVENPKYRLYGGVTFNEYVQKDVLFISVTKTSYRKQAYEIIKDIMDKRMRLGKPTFVLSEYFLSEISDRDYSGNFMRSLDRDAKKVDYYQYPMILEYMPKWEVAHAQ